MSIVKVEYYPFGYPYSTISMTHRQISFCFTTFAKHTTQPLNVSRFNPKKR
jgi:hypothetical protein